MLSKVSKYFLEMMIDWAYHIVHTIGQGLLVGRCHGVQETL